MLVFVLGAALFLPLLQRVETSRYLVVLVPALAALVWRSLPIIGSMANLPERIGPRISHPRWGRITFVGLLTTYGLMSVVPTAAVVIAHRNASYDRCMARITQHIPKNAAVMAHTMFWTGLHDRRFVSSIPPSFSEWVSEDDAAAFIREHRPEYVVQSSGLYSSVGGLGPRPSDLRATVFDRACEQVAATVHSEILTEFYDRDFGAVRAWKRTWPEGD